MTNTIIWNNTPESIYLLPETEEHIPNIIYSDIEDGFEGDGNIHEDPLFTDPENGDFTLMEDSPCIDAGTIIEGMEYCGDAPDMGAFEYITEDCEECPDSVEGDTNFDGTVNVLDIVIVANCILSDSCVICFDLNGDGIINVLDVVVLANIILGG